MAELGPGLGEDPVEAHQHDLFQQHETRAGAGQPDEALELGRQRDQHRHRLLAMGIAQAERDGGGAIGEEGKGMGRIDGERGQDRIDIGDELRLQPVTIGGAKIGRTQDLDRLDAKLHLELAPAFLLGHVQPRRRPFDQGQLLLRRTVVGAQLMDAGTALGLQGGDPHGLELVEIAGRDRQEAQPLQQGMRRIAGLLQYPGVEGEPGDLAIEESVGRRGRTGELLFRLDGFRRGGRALDACHGLVILRKIRSSRFCGALRRCHELTPHRLGAGVPGGRRSALAGEETGEHACPFCVG